MEPLNHDDAFAIYFSEDEKALLWGWDKRLWHYMTRRDLPQLVKALRKRLIGRAITCLARTSPSQAELFESAARGWKLVTDRLAVKHSEAA